MGQLISPLRNFIDKYIKRITKLYFASCCASKDAAKYDKFGYGIVFQLVESMLGDKCIHCAAFPIDLVLPADKTEDSNTLMKRALSAITMIGQSASDLSFLRKLMNASEFMLPSMVANRMSPRGVTAEINLIPKRSPLSSTTGVWPISPQVVPQWWSLRIEDSSTK